jgi:hypothetical protein
MSAWGSMSVILTRLPLYRAVPSALRVWRAGTCGPQAFIPSTFGQPHVRYSPGHCRADRLSVHESAARAAGAAVAH